MKSKLSALVATALLAACSAVPQHNEQAKALLDEGIACIKNRITNMQCPTLSKLNRLGI